MFHTVLSASIAVLLIIYTTTDFLLHSKSLDIMLLLLPFHTAATFIRFAYLPVPIRKIFYCYLISLYALLLKASSCVITLPVTGFIVVIIIIGLVITYVNRFLI